MIRSPFGDSGDFERPLLFFLPYRLGGVWGMKQNTILRENRMSGVDAELGMFARTLPATG
jgi:hypothetical protein